MTGDASAARALFEQDRIGSTALGKQADFALLDRDVLTVTAGEARDTNVLWTIVGGQTVYGTKPSTFRRAGTGSGRMVVAYTEISQKQPCGRSLVMPSNRTSGQE